MGVMRTAVGIVGAGAGGLLLSQLLYLRGIESIVLEHRCREYVERRTRAGMLEQGTVETLREAGVAERLNRESLRHEGFELRFDDRRYRMPLTELTGQHIWIYGQQEVVKDLIAARVAAGGQIHFSVRDVALSNLCTKKPVIRCTLDGEPVQIVCDFIAGCDGFHGVSRQSIPAAKLSIMENVYPCSWLGILAATPPSAEELIYAVHARGFALHSMRSPRVSRFYLQVDAEEDILSWPDERIWKELHARLGTSGGSFALTEGPVLEKGITALRSFVAEPMRYGRLFLAGDAAHIVPPSAAKGLNLAVADVVLLAEAIGRYCATGRPDLLDGYSEACLRGVWQAQEFSAFMTTLLHRFPGSSRFEDQLQLARLHHLTRSTAAATSFAENYVGAGRR